MRDTIVAALLVMLVAFSASAQGNATGSTRLIEKRPIAGAVVASIDAGDFVLPRFSPDGKQLAYVSVTFTNGIELDEVILIDIASQKTRKLIDVREAKRYATYSASVTSMEWSGRNRLRVSMNDGDVDTEHITFNTNSGRIFERRHTSDDDDTAFAAMTWMSRTELTARANAVKAFGDSIAGPLDSALMSSGFITGDGRIVGRGLGPILEGDVWLLDPTAPTRTALLPRPGFPWSSDLLGGVDIGNRLLLVLSVQGNARFVRVGRGGETADLGQIENVTNDRDLRILRVVDDRALVLLRRHGGGERGSNPVVFVDGDSLVESSDYTEIADADVDPRMRNIAFAVWTKDDKRHLVIRQLVPR